MFGPRYAPVRYTRPPSTVSPVKLQISTVSPIKLRISTISPIKLRISMVSPVKLRISTVSPVKLRISTVSPVKLRIITVSPVKLYISWLPLQIVGLVGCKITEIYLRSNNFFHFLYIINCLTKLLDTDNGSILDVFKSH